MRGRWKSVDSCYCSEDERAAQRPAYEAEAAGGPVCRDRRDVVFLREEVDEGGELDAAGLEVVGLLVIGSRVEDIDILR